RPHQSHRLAHGRRSTNRRQRPSRNESRRQGRDRHEDSRPRRSRPAAGRSHQVRSVSRHPRRLHYRRRKQVATGGFAAPHRSRVDRGSEPTTKQGGTGPLGCPGGRSRASLAAKDRILEASVPLGAQRSQLRFMSCLIKAILYTGATVEAKLPSHRTVCTSPRPSNLLLALTHAKSTAHSPAHPLHSP